MSIESWDPFRRLEEFRAESNKMFDSLFADLPASSPDDSIAFAPEADLVETANEFRFYLSVPGLVEDDILIAVDGQELTIRGERRPSYDAEFRDAKLQEWRYGFFERHFELATLVEIATIRAAYDAGVLTIIVEKLNSVDENVGLI